MRELVSWEVSKHRHSRAKPTMARAPQLSHAGNLNARATGQLPLWTVGSSDDQRPITTVISVSNTHNYHQRALHEYLPSIANMRQRVTFITKPIHALAPDQLSIVDGTLTGPPISAIREDRLTFALDELPGGVQKILRESHELHIRWSSPSPSESLSPLLSRVPPGFHLFYTPLSASAAKSWVHCYSAVKSCADGKDRESLCLALRSLFGNISCRTPEVCLTCQNLE
jgi:hypothetical protein